jgi:hypothetical protein
VAGLSPFVGPLAGTACPLGLRLRWLLNPRLSQHGPRTAEPFPYAQEEPCVCAALRSRRVMLFEEVDRHVGVGRATRAPSDQQP